MRVDEVNCFLNIVVGVAFIPSGVSMINSSNSIFESTIVYDGSNSDIDCSIDNQNEGKKCDVSC